VGQRSRLPNARRKARIFIVPVSLPLSQQMFDAIKTDYQLSADRNDNPLRPGVSLAYSCGFSFSSWHGADAECACEDGRAPSVAAWVCRCRACRSCFADARALDGVARRL